MNRRTHGFTLAEMLVALVITAVLVLLLVNVVSAALTIWEHGRNQIDTFAKARQVLGRIADEVSGALAASAPRPVEFSENLASIQSTSPVPTTSENVFFVAPYPNVTSGDLCVIAYRHNNNTHTLERGFIDSRNAWNGAATNRYQSAGYTSSNFQWRTIANGVLEFEIQAYSQQDLDTTTSPSPTPIASWTSAGSGVMSGNTPRQVTVRIKVVDDRTLVKLAGLPPGNATCDRLVTRAARDFTVSVVLPPPH